MMDMFTIILVFLLKSYSAQGQLVTPAEGLMLPNSSVQKSAEQGLEMKISNTNIMVEEFVIVGENKIKTVLEQKDFLIDTLLTVLSEYAEESRQTAETYGQEFKGKVSIQGDVSVPYNLLVKLMYTCGQAGFPNINLVVYKE